MWIHGLGGRGACRRQHPSRISHVPAVEMDRVQRPRRKIGHLAARAGRRNPCQFRQPGNGLTDHSPNHDARHWCIRPGKLLAAREAAGVIASHSAPTTESDGPQRVYTPS
jgi:hypothetical protein